MNTEFEELINDLNRYVVTLRSGHGSPEELRVMSSYLERVLGEAITLHKKDCDAVFSQKKVFDCLNEIKRFCSSKGKTEYQIDHDSSMISIKKGARWAEYKLIPLHTILNSFFRINSADKYYNFIAVYLSQEDNFTLIQVYIILMAESTVLH